MDLRQISINSPQNPAASYLESQQLLDSMLQRVGQVLDSKDVYIYIIDDKKTMVELIAGIGLYHKWIGHCRLLENSLCAKVLTTGQPHVGYKFRDYNDLESLWEKDVEAIIALPLRIEGKIKGVVGVGLSGEHQVPKQKEKVLLEGISEMLAMVLGRIDKFYRMSSEQSGLCSEERKIWHIHDCMSELFSVLNKDACFEFLVKAHEEMLGYKNDELLGTSVFALIHPEDQLTVKQSFRKFCAAGQEHFPQTLECRFRHKDGWYMWLETTAIIMRDDQDKVVGILLSSREITERKEAQRALEESEEKFRLLFNNANDAICLAELLPGGRPGQIVEVNKVFCQLWGYSRSQILHTSLASLMPLWETSDFAAKRQRLQRGGHILFETTQENLQGDSFSLEVNARALVINEQWFIMMIGRNTSERRRMEQEMLKLERLNVIGEMAAGIGHEVRNPLTTVRGMLQMMNKREQNGQNEEFYTMMIDELDRAHGIITEFLSVARDKTIKFEPVNLNSVVNALAPLIQADAQLVRKRLQLALGEVSLVLADQKEIRQLILNLARNGLDAMNEGGTLTIATEGLPLGVRLIIKDDGPGIPTAVLAKLGTPFFTTKEHGTGLGLVVCYSIAKHHGTTLDVETGKEGTAFSIVFRKAEQ
jgi:PAS domain S-box-containing protein